MNSKRNKWEFYEACSSGDLPYIKRIIHKSNVNQTCPYGKTGFIMACINGHIDVIKFLLKFKLNFNKLDKFGKTGFIYACEYNRLEIVRLLIVNPEIDVNKCSINAMNAFMVACHKYNIDIVNLLIYNSRVNLTRTLKGKTPLMVVCENPYLHVNRLKLIKILLTNNLSLNEVDYYGNTAFMTVCINNDIEAATLLLANKDIDINIANNENKTAYDLIVEREYRILENLLESSERITNCRITRSFISVIFARTLSMLNI